MEIFSALIALFILTAAVAEPVVEQTTTENSETVVEE